MDKKVILKKYENFMDKEGAFIKALDQLWASDLYGELHVTDFLSPDLVAMLSEIALFETDITPIFFGGFDLAERKRMVFAPNYAEEMPEESGFNALLQIAYPSKFGELGHKDVLGALMGLGISRSKCGDIIPIANGFQVVLDKDILEFVTMTLEKVGRMKVTLQALDLSAVKTPEISFIESSGTVPSERLDAILAFGFRLSRQEAKTFIEQGLVKVNHLLCTQASKSVEKDMLISCRGEGRFIVSEIGHETKKGRIRVLILKYPKN